MIVLFAIPVLILCELCASQEITNVEDIQTLSELPLEKLLSLKKVFRPEEGHVGEIGVAGEKSDAGSPEALALQKPMRDRGGSYQYHYEEEYHHPKQEKNKIQSIFQISVTALAFLAFAGYLLCLLIHAINEKQNYYNGNQSATTPTAQNMAAILARLQRKKKKNLRPRIRKRPKPSINVNSNFNRYRRDEHNRTKRDVFDDSLTDKMYDALLSVAEGFTNYHTIDYVHFNSSASYVHTNKVHVL